MTHWREHPDTKLLKALGRLNIRDLQPYGVEPLLVTGAFLDPDIPLRLCAEHPELHIVSRVSRRGLPCYINRLVPNATGYFVANGTTDPSIEVCPPPLPPEELEELLHGLPPEPGTEVSIETREFQSRLFRNIAHKRPLYEGIFETRAEIEAHRAQALKSCGINLRKKRS